MKKFTLDVLMIAYNHEKYISQAIESLKKQTYQDFNFLFLDDGSSDNTLEILRTCMKSFPFPYMVIGNEENQGRGYSRNKILNRSKADLCCWFDADDRMASNKLEAQIKYFQGNSNIYFLGTEMISILNDEGKTELGCHVASDYKLMKSVSDFDMINPFANPTMMFKRESAIKIGGYNESLRENEDLDFWKRALTAGYKIECLSERLYYHRLGSHS